VRLHARGCPVLLAFAVLHVVASARADDAAPVASTAASVESTAHDVAHDRATRSRADLPARLSGPDTADGRVAGDVGVVVGVGVTVAEEPRAAAELRLRYLDMAGLFLTYEDGIGSASVGPARVLATGIEVRPLFLGRWVTGNELGIRWSDLVIDSFGIELGGFFAQPPLGSFGSPPGLQAGLGFELPLLGAADGPWIDVHGGARWSDAVIAGGPVHGPADRALFLSLTLSWHHIFATHLVDAGDMAPR
jgi:hypothetical protein